MVLQVIYLISASLLSRDPENYRFHVVMEPEVITMNAVAVAVFANAVLQLIYKRIMRHKSTAI